MIETKPCVTVASRVDQDISNQIDLLLQEYTSLNNVKITRSQLIATLIAKGLDSARHTLNAMKRARGL